MMRGVEEDRFTHSSEANGHAAVGERLPVTLESEKSGKRFVFHLVMENKGLLMSGFVCQTLASARNDVIEFSSMVEVILSSSSTILKIFVQERKILLNYCL